jgi:hypothetical protein
VKTYRELTHENVSKDYLDSQFAGKPAIDLLRAVHNPDHSSAAVEALTGLLHARGISDAEIAAARINPQELFVWPLNQRPSFEAALRRPKRWRAIYRAMQIGSVLAFVAFLFFHALETDVEVNFLREQSAIFNEQQAQAAEEARNGFTRAGDSLLKQPDFWKRMPMPYAGWRTLSVLLFLLLFAPALKALAWGSPSRILLLRPFGTQGVSRSLKKFIHRNVIFSGHVFTLADQHMRESFLGYVIASIPTSEGELVLFLLQLLRIVGSQRRRMHVRKARHYQDLKRRLRSGFLLNSFWVTSFDKIRKIKTSDRWWQRCIDLLAANCEVILVDLSVVKAGTHWELGKIRQEHLEEKAIFIVQRQKLNWALASLAEHWPRETLPRIFLYDAKGIVQDEPEFKRRFARILSLERAPVPGRERPLSAAPLI